MKIKPLLPQRFRGRSLIELLIAMLIALITMAAVVYAISGASVTGDQQNAFTQFNEEAAVAASVLNANFKNAGFSIPRNTKSPLQSVNYAGPPVYGCENGFTNVATAPPNNCVGGGGTNPDAVVVRYEATTDNTDFTGVGPIDCLGAAIPPTTASEIDPAVLYSMADNRYFVLNNTLMCAGPGNPWIPQALIENVVDMQITYGIANVITPPTTTADQGGYGDPGNTPITYLDANQVAALGQMTAGTNTSLDFVANDPRLSPWKRVVNVRICLELRSEPNAISEDLPAYRDCRGNAQIRTDRRLYRTVNVVVAMRNRAPPCADSSTATANLCTANSSNIGR